MTEAASPDQRDAFAKRVSVFTEIGFSPERIVAQLIQGGFPRDWIAAEFPHVPLGNFPDAPAPRTSRISVMKTAGQGATVQSAHTQLPLVLKSIRTPPATPKPTTAPVAHIAPQTPTEPDSISFQYVPLIQCSFPHADPGDVTTFTRRNGWLELTLSSARAETGLPYGVPARLLTIYCASEAIRTKSPEIFLGHSVNDFLRRLEVPITRGERGSQRVYANQLLRLIHCAISIDENITDGHGRTGLHIRQALFAQEAQLWWDGDGAGEGSSLVLSPVLFESILERSAPLSTNAIKQLRKSPMDLDVYAWLVHRLFTLSKPSTISWAQLSGQFGHGYALPRKFRSYFLDSLKRVHAVYPEAKVNVSTTGLTLLPSKRHVAPAIVTVPG
jgi:hypothetical protein